MAKSRGGKKRCSIGKSCGATCISKGKVCIKELNGNVSTGASQLKGMLTQGSPPPVAKQSSPPQPKVPLSVSAKVGSLPVSSGNRTEMNKGPALIKAEAEAREKERRELTRAVTRAMQDSSKIDEGRLKKREKELAKEFKDKNGRWPNRRGERDKIRNQAWREQMKEIRDRREKMEKLEGMKVSKEDVAKASAKMKEERRKKLEEYEKDPKKKALLDAIRAAVAKNPPSPLDTPGWKPGILPDSWLKEINRTSKRHSELEELYYSNRKRPKFTLESSAISRAIVRIRELEDSGKKFSNDQIIRMIDKFSKEEYPKVVKDDEEARERWRKYREELNKGK